MSKISFIGIGGQRCATTWLYEMLKSHNEIDFPNEKEVHFFSYYYHFGYDWYESLFQKKKSHNLGEFSTSYLYDIQAPERVKKYNEKMKILVVIRNPIDRLISHFRHEIELGNVDINNWDLSLESLEKNPTLFDYGLYWKYLSLWMSFFSRDQIFITLYDDILNDNKKVLKNIYNFLEVNEKFIPPQKGKIINASIIPKSISFNKKLNFVAKSMRSLKLGFLVDQAKKVGIKEFSDNTNSKIINYKKYLNDSSLKTIISKKYDDDIKKLSDLVEKNLVKLWGS